MKKIVNKIIKFYNAIIQKKLTSQRDSIEVEKILEREIKVKNDIGVVFHHAGQKGVFCQSLWGKSFKI